MIYIDGEEYIPLGNGILQNKMTGKKYYSKVFPIDHGYSFPIFASKENPRSVILSRFAHNIWGKKIPERYLANIMSLKDPKFQLKLKSLLESEAFKLFNERIDYLLRGYAKFPKYRIVRKIKGIPMSEKVKEE